VLDGRRCGVRFLEESKTYPFLQSVQDPVRVSPTSCPLGTAYGFLFKLKSCDRTVNLTTHLVIVSTLRMSGTVLPFPPFDIMTCIGLTFISLSTLLVGRSRNRSPGRVIVVFFPIRPTIPCALESTQTLKKFVPGYSWG
jgi:hypothetical protein